jgi:hypothetical protein
VNPNPAPQPGPKPELPTAPAPHPARAAAPKAANPAKGVPRPRVVVSGLNRRDIIIGVMIAVALIGLILLLIFSVGGYQERNKFSGVVRGHNDPGLRETLMTVSRKGVSEKTADTGYSLKVWVESQKREYEVMVSKKTWDETKDGEEIRFMRPPSEQR